MKKIFRKALALVAGLFILSSSFSVFAFDLNYSGGSTSNSTGAGNTTSGYQISVINPTYGNNVGYRFSIVDGSGNLKSGSKVANIYLNDTTYGTAAYNSAQRFIVSAGTVANKKQLASNTKVTTAYGAQACEYLAGNVGFYSIPGQDPAAIRSWIQDSSVNYKNLKLIYLVCGLELAKASANDYVLIEPILRVELAGVITAATPTELAVYGASVSGGGQYNGANGKLSNTGSGTLWNLQYYINREFPNLLYVDKDITVYSAVSVISSGRYTYNDIIQKGYGCSVLQVSNILPQKSVRVIFNKNDGSGDVAEQTFVYGASGNRFGYNNDGTPKWSNNSGQFGGWDRTGYTLLGWSESAAATTAGYETYSGVGNFWINEKVPYPKTSGTVDLYAVWSNNAYTNTIGHWAWGFNGNGNNGNRSAFHLTDTAFTKNYSDVFTLTEADATAIPNGFYLNNTSQISTSSVDGTWKNYPYGTKFTQKAGRMDFEYDYAPIDYNISYELDGGTNNSNNPTTYNVLYEKTLSAPTKKGYEFLGWNRRVTKKIITLPAISTNYCNYNILNDIEPGTEYEITIGNAKTTAGSSSMFSCVIYDFTADKTLALKNVAFGSDLSFSVTCPSSADTTHDIRLLFYSGVAGSTSGVGTAYTDVELNFYVDGINKGCGSAFADVNALYSELTKRTTGDILLIAKWKRNADIVYKVQHWLQNIDGDASLKDSNNYTLDYTESLAGAAGESITPEVKAYKGFTSPAAQTVTINPDGSTVVNYYYTRNRYTVTLNKGTGISSVTGAGTYLYGASVTINATVSQGYTWSKWTGTYNTATQKYTFTMPCENVTDTANAVPNTYTVVYDGNGSTGGSTPNSTHVYNVEKNLNANGYVRDGYSFLGWNTEADGTGTAYTDKQTVKNLTSVNGGVVILYAQWKRNVKIVYKVQHWLQNIDGNASIKNSDNYTLADSESFTKEIYGDVNSDGYVNSADLTYLKKILLSMISEPITTGDVNGDGSTDILDLVRLKKYLAGAADESVTPGVKAYKGFTSPATQTVTINPDGSTVVNYYYTRNRYTVTLNKGTGISSVTGAGTYLYGASVTINATVSQGYTWSKWTGTYNTATQKYTFTMPCENVTDTANAVPNTYTVVYDGNGSTGGSTPNSTHVYNVEKNLNANGYVRDGYSFLGWNTEADGTGTAYTDKQTVKNLTSVNGGVVTLYAQWQARLTLVPLEPNAPYREDTEVITSYWIVNSSTENCIPSDNIKVAFTVYNANGDILKTADQIVIVPARDKNLIYFKWKVPEDLSRNDVTVKAVIKDGGSNYGLVGKSYATVPYIYYTTPDTEYEAKAPDGFSVPTAPTDTGILSAKWWEYKYENGSFKKVNYGIGTKLNLSPLSAPDSLSAQMTGGRLTLRSGYGFRSPFGAYTLGIEGYTMPDSASYTERQYAYALFPEFNYSFGENKCKTFKEVGNVFDFYDSYYTHINHYIPLYYPDGEYTFEIDVTDSWTPAGMITTSDLQTITVSGSLYDDHYIGRK